MSRRAFEVNISLGQLPGMGEALDKIGTNALLGAATQAVNEVTTRFNEAQQARQIADINLSAQYVRERTLVRLANQSGDGSTRATITTDGRLTVMDRYPLQAPIDPEARDKRGARIGKRLGGATVAIKPSAPVTEPKWFLMKLKNNEGRLGVFVRTSAGKKKHLYGPSPYSLFRFQARTGEGEILDDLDNTSASAFADAIEKALNT